MEAIQLANATLIGRNKQYEFAVGQLEGGRWIGYAIGTTAGGTRCMFLFPQISERHLAGLLDRELAIRMTAAIAQDWAQGYGGVTDWSIDERLRAGPEEFRCARCGDVCCDGTCGQECYGEDGFFEG